MQVVLIFILESFETLLILLGETGAPTCLGDALVCLVGLLTLLASAIASAKTLPVRDSCAMTCLELVTG